MDDPKRDLERHIKRARSAAEDLAQMLHKFPSAGIAQQVKALNYVIYRFFQCLLDRITSNNAVVLV
jgi:hypothetical protein